MKAALLDSNVLIYAANGNAESLREFVCSAGNAVASITGIEVYGFSGLKHEEKASLDTLFAFLDVYSLDERVIAKAIELRQFRKMGLADAMKPKMGGIGRFESRESRVESRESRAGRESEKWESGKIVTLPMSCIWARVFLWIIPRSSRSSQASAVVSPAFEECESPYRMCFPIWLPECLRKRFSVIFPS